LVKLLKLPTILKVGDKELADKKTKKTSNDEPVNVRNNQNYEDTNVKIFDDSQTGPLYQFR